VTRTQGRSLFSPSLRALVLLLLLLLLLLPLSLLLLSLLPVLLLVRCGGGAGPTALSHLVIADESCAIDGAPPLA
jgi:hypothetical protein